MKAVNLIQGTPEWHAHRANHFNASDAPAMMGVSPYKTRSQLLHEMATGITPDVDPATQRRFDDGHRFESLARPLAEEIIGEVLYPVTGTNGRHSASFDGLTLGEDKAFEHKTLNAEITAAFEQMDRMGPHDDAAACRLLPEVYRVQMEHQLIVSGAERVLFMGSKWSGDELVEQRHCWYYPDATLRAAIIAGWEQFERDLSAYTPPAAAEPAPVGKAPDTLPALLVQVTGAVTASNLADFKAVALGAIRSVNRDLRTDQDFADADKAVKWCGDVETRIEAAKEHALSQTASIDALFKALDDIKSEARDVRLGLEKLVKARKESVKSEAVEAARAAMASHIASLNAELAPIRLSLPPVDFGAAIKGLKTFASMNDKLGTALAAGKIAADAQARVIRQNLADFKILAAGFEHLFSDLQTLALKDGGDFMALVGARIANHKAAEAAKEAQRKADEERRIAEAEARAREQERARIAEEQRRKEAATLAEAERIARERHAEEVREQYVKAEAERMESEAARAKLLAAVQEVSAGNPADPDLFGKPADTTKPAEIKLGDICRHLGLTMSADFVAGTLGVPHDATDKNAKLYTLANARRIMLALSEHAAKCADSIGSDQIS